MTYLRGGHPWAASPPALNTAPGSLGYQQIPLTKTRRFTLDSNAVRKGKRPEKRKKGKMVMRLRRDKKRETTKGINKREKIIKGEKKGEAQRKMSKRRRLERT